MRTRIGVLLGLVGSLGVAGDAAAQKAELFAGGGATFSGADVSQVDGHAMLGATVRLSPGFGVRVDGVYTPDDGDDLIGVSGAGVASFGAADARVRPYLLGGGSVFFTGGDTEAGVGGGAGVRFAATDRVGVFVEGRYTYVFDVAYNSLIYATAGISVALP